MKVVEDVPQEPPEEPKKNDPPSKAVTVYLMADGNISIEPHGFSHLELPTLLKLAARTVEKQLGL